MKHYYIIHGDFANCYALYWAENRTEELELIALGAVNITRKDAIKYARAERYRRRYDAAFAYNADSLIYSWSYRNRNTVSHDFELDNTGYIVLKEV